MKRKADKKLINEMGNKLDKLAELWAETLKSINEITGAKNNN